MWGRESKGLVKVVIVLLVYPHCPFPSETTLREICNVDAISYTGFVGSIFKSGELNWIDIISTLSFIVILSLRCAREAAEGENHVSFLALESIGKDWWDQPDNGDGVGMSVREELRNQKVSSKGQFTVVWDEKCEGCVFLVIAQPVSNTNSPSSYQ